MLFSDEYKFHLHDIRPAGIPNGQRLNAYWSRIASLDKELGQFIILIDRLMYQDMLQDVMLLYAEEEMPLK